MVSRIYVVCWHTVDGVWLTYAPTTNAHDAHGVLVWLSQRPTVVDTVCLWFDVTSPHLGLNDPSDLWLTHPESQIVEVTPW